MRIKQKLQLLIIPMILIPVVITAYIFVMNTSASIRTLHSENMQRNLEIIMNQLEQENSVIERLGAENTQFYKRNAQNHARSFILELQLVDGTIQIYEKKTREIVNEDSVFDRDFYEEIYSGVVTEAGVTTAPIEKIIEKDLGNYAVYYQLFEPWDWIVLIYMDEDIIYQSIDKSINQILFVVVMFSIIIGFFLYITTAKLTAPVDTLMDAVKSIGDGDYSKKVIIDTNDEFRELAQAFNDMSTKLQESFDNLNQMTDELMLMNTELEKRVEARTSELKDTNAELELSIIQLRATQDDLVESRKIAALGSLVTGISHELNTPIGIGITTASYIVMQINSLIDLYIRGQLKKQEFESELESIKNSANLILDNLNNASGMVNSFKLLAVDQSTEEKKEFELTHNIETLIQNMNVLLRKGRHKASIEYDKPVEMVSYPGAISQVITHFVMNSIQHGFSGIEEGEIKIYIRKEGKYVTIVFEDNGHGMDEEKVHRIFEPFYTSKLGAGTSGLGLNIVYNLVTSVLKGKISAISQYEDGMRFTLVLPTIVKDA